MKRQFWPALKAYLVFTLLCGLLYPVVMTVLAQGIFSSQATGSILSRDGHPIASYWIGQKFTSAKYFWSRPSASDYAPIGSGGSNWGPLSNDLKKAVSERTAILLAQNNNQPPPADLILASGSGLDPHISPAAARYQVERVAKARNVDPERVRALIQEYTMGRTFSLLGDPVVHVVELNLALDRNWP